eukprot:4073760-Pyramimonas_sp.AAC.1
MLKASFGSQRIPQAPLWVPLGTPQDSLVFFQIPRDSPGSPRLPLDSSGLFWIRQDSSRTLTIPQDSSRGSRVPQDHTGTLGPQRILQDLPR